MLIEIHILQNHAPSNLNRDDTGSPKECVFGEIKRARISSQCLKRTIRQSETFQDALSQDRLAQRTRKLPELVQKAFVAAGYSSEFAEIAAKRASGFGNKDGKEQENLETAQMIFLTQSDVDAVVKTLIDAATGKSLKEFEKTTAKDLQAKTRPEGFRPITVDVALFGRMTTSEAFRDVQAACQVAHAISTHKIDHEFDYFTAVDDLQGKSETEEDAGAGMIGDVEFNSACYYKYFSIDIEGIVDNLTGKSAHKLNIGEDELQAAKSLAADAVVALLKAAITTTPSGKQNSFAANQLPSLVLVEARPKRTPVSYANAFVKPARSNRDSSLIDASIEQLKKHVETITTAFDLESAVRLLFAPESEVKIDGTVKIGTVNDLSSQLRKVALNG